MRLALVANRQSGSGTDVALVETTLRSLGAEVDAHDIADVSRAAGSGAERLAVAGGDGSMAPAAAAAGSAGVPLAVIPTGTANDFARKLGIPHDLAESCALAVSGASEARVDLARMGTRPFVNVASAGLAVPAAQTAGDLKRPLGKLAYAAGALRAGMSSPAIDCRVTCDGEELFRGRAWQAMVASAGAFGGGAQLEPADETDGLLDATVIEATSRARLLVHGYGLRSGRGVRQRGVHHRRGGTIVVELVDGRGFNVDGELVHQGSAEFRVEPGAFRVIVPRPAARGVPSNK